MKRMRRAWVSPFALRRLSRQLSIVSAAPKATVALSCAAVDPGSSSRRTGADQLLRLGSYLEPQMSCDVLRVSPHTAHAKPSGRTLSPSDWAFAGEGLTTTEAGDADHVLPAGRRRARIRAGDVRASIQAADDSDPDMAHGRRPAAADRSRGVGSPCST